MHVLRTLKFDGSTQAIPVTNIYTDKNYRVTSGDDSDVQPRFDFVTILKNEERLPVQLLSIIEILFPSRTTPGKQSCVFFYIAAELEKIQKTRSRLSKSFYVSKVLLLH
jgi:hypothetical protein